MKTISIPRNWPGKLSKLAAAMFTLALPAFANAAISCDGSAAKAVKVTWEEGRYDTTNIDRDRTITVTFDLVAGGSITLTLAPGETQFPAYVYPLQSYKSPCHAEYQ
jgi:hypothetical protein